MTMTSRIHVRGSIRPARDQRIGAGAPHPSDICATTVATSNWVQVRLPMCSRRGLGARDAVWGRPAGSGLASCVALSRGHFTAVLCRHRRLLAALSASVPIQD